jgi:hypothetical protein
MLEMLSELQLMDEIDILGIAIGMKFKRRAPKSSVWRKVVVVFR